MTSFRSIYVLLVARYERTTPLLSKLLLLCILSHMPIFSTLLELFCLKNIDYEKNQKKKSLTFHTVLCHRHILRKRFTCRLQPVSIHPFQSPRRAGYHTVPPCSDPVPEAVPRCIHPVSLPLHPARFSGNWF